MNFPFYRGDGKKQTDGSSEPLPVSRRADLISPEKYMADPGLVDACNVALLLSQPLLLTGEPGTGKTQFAYSLAWELGLKKPLKFETKSNSTARDLFYTYDALKRFQDVQSRTPAQNTNVYLTYHALGAAILLTREKSEVERFLSPDFEHNEKCRSLVLIDEIDKAPRDFPNDMLNEMELQYFRVPELKNEKIEADPALNPIVVVTSNSEKDLPDAFLRRCVYYDIPFPTPERLRDIVTNRLGLYASGTQKFLDDALNLFFKLRAPESGMRKKPSTAELLGWIVSLKSISGDKENPLTTPELALQTLSTLVKTREDQHKAEKIVQQWVKEQKS